MFCSILTIRSTPGGYCIFSAYYPEIQSNKQKKQEGAPDLIRPQIVLWNVTIDSNRSDAYTS